MVYLTISELALKIPKRPKNFDHFKDLFKHCIKLFLQNSSGKSFFGYYPWTIQKDLVIFRAENVCSKFQFFNGTYVNLFFSFQPNYPDESSPQLHDNAVEYETSTFLRRVREALLSRCVYIFFKENSILFFYKYSLFSDFKFQDAKNSKPFYLDSTFGSLGNVCSSSLFL